MPRRIAPGSAAAWLGKSPRSGALAFFAGYTKAFEGASKLAHSKGFASAKKLCGMGRDDAPGKQSSALRILTLRG